MTYRIEDRPNKHNDGGRIVVLRRWAGLWWVKFTAHYGALPAWDSVRARGYGVWVPRKDAIAKASAALRNMHRQVEVIAESAESSGELSVVD